MNPTFRYAVFLVGVTIFAVGCCEKSIWLPLNIGANYRSRFEVFRPYELQYYPQDHKFTFEPEVRKCDERRVYFDGVFLGVLEADSSESWIDFWATNEGLYFWKMGAQLGEREQEDLPDRHWIGKVSQDFSVAQCADISEIVNSSFKVEFVESEGDDAAIFRVFDSAEWEPRTFSVSYDCGD